MVNHKLSLVWVIGVAMLLAGCGNLKGPDGRKVTLQQYDSVIVADVKVASSVSKKQTGPLLKGVLQAELLSSKKFQPAEDFDFESFAKYVETYMTTPGTINGKRIPSAMTSEEFTKQYVKKKEELRPFLNRPKGTRPLRVRITITKLTFPGGVEKVVMGSKAGLESRIDVYAANSAQPLGSADIKVTDTMPGSPIMPIGMAVNAAKSIIEGAYTRKTVMNLVTKTSKEIVKQLEKAK